VASDFSAAHLLFDFNFHIRSKSFFNQVQNDDNTVVNYRVK